jgi:hypothetical protein
MPAEDAAPAADAACASDAVDALSELPAVLLSQLLLALCAAAKASGVAADEGGARSLLRLAACSTHLARAVAGADDVWQARARRNTACGAASVRRRVDP